MRRWVAVGGAAAIAWMAAFVGCQSTAPGEQMVVGRTAEWTGASDDPESNTRWHLSPVYLRDAQGGLHSLGLKSFEGVEEPTMKWVEGSNGGHAERDEFVNITEPEPGVVRMFLRYRGNGSTGWWDGDQGTSRRDRQRAEIKGLGPHQKMGETFEYGTTFRTDPDFKGYARFCHIMQVKATDGDKGAPLVTLSILDNTHAALRYVSGTGGFKDAQGFEWKPGEWMTIRFRLTTSTGNNGALLLSVNGGPFKGVTGVPMYRPRATDYRPKWGLYRGVVPAMRDDWVEHKEGYARKIAP
jgi:hypothetical protein